MATGEDLYKLLQIMMVSIGVITAGITGLKYLRKQLLKDMKSDLSGDIEPIKKEQTDINVRVSLLERTVEFIERYFTKPRQRENQDDR